MDGTKGKTKLATAFLFLALAFAIFSVKTFADTATGQVSISNAGPTVGTVTLWNQADADAAITLTAGSTVTVIANATITDTNGGGDISSANATLHHSTSTAGAADDENVHLTNGTCILGSASGNTKTVNCQFTMNYMATNGTWTATINAYDASGETGSATDTNTVNDLASLDVLNATIDLGTMALGANSSAGQAMAVRNLGNVQIDAQFSGDDYSCTAGTIGVGNARYSLTDGTYDSMSTDLSGVATTQTSFDLGVRGAATANGANSDENEFFTILIPSSGVGGTCTNTLTVNAVAG